MAQRSIATRNAALDAENALLDGGTVEIRSGSPAPVDSPPTGSVLVIFNIGNPAFGAAVSGIAVANAIAGVTAAAGNAGGTVHYVAKDSLNNVQRNGTAGTSGTDMIISTLTWNLGDNVNITAWTASEAT